MFETGKEEKLYVKREYKGTVFRILFGKNKELMERCRTLKEYSQYVACVRKYKETETLEDAVDHAAVFACDVNMRSVRVYAKAHTFYAV